MADTTTKKIFINARFLTKSVTGVERYALELVKALDFLIDAGKINPKMFRFILIAPKETRYELELKHLLIRHIGHLNGHLWEQLELPFYTRGELLISLCNTGPLLKRCQVATIHDAATFSCPQAYSLAFRIFYQLLLTGLGVTSKKVLTVSLFSQKELIDHCRISKGKLQVIYEGKEHALAAKPDYSILREHNLLNKVFVLAVGSINPNKNFRSIALAVKLLGNINFELVIAGSTNPKVFSKLPAPLPNDVKHLGYVSDGELRALYEHATCFIYPSFYEGFGLPPLEAMACGCPVIVSNTASLPEVCGEAAIYCDPEDPEDIAEKIRHLLSNEALQKELQQKGLERAKQFTWERCAMETFAAISKFAS